MIADYHRIESTHLIDPMAKEMAELLYKNGYCPDYWFSSPPSIDLPKKRKEDVCRFWMRSDFHISKVAIMEVHPQIKGCRCSWAIISNDGFLYPDEPVLSIDQMAELITLSTIVSINGV